MKRMRKAVAALLAGAMIITSLPSSALAAQMDAGGSPAAVQVDEPALPQETIAQQSADFVVLGEAGEEVASGTCGTNLTWSLDGSGLLTISGSGEMDTYSTSSVAPWSDYKSSIASVVVEEGVTSVGNYAFYGCSNLASVVFPETLTSIGAYAFYQCTGLAGELVLPDSLDIIGIYAFYKCTGLTGALVIPDQVRTIASSAFDSCSSLTSAVIGDGLAQINDNLFSNCTQLQTVEIGSGVTKIGTYALAKYSPFYQCSAITEIVFTGTTVPEISSVLNVFGKLSSLTTVSVPEGTYSGYADVLAAGITGNARIRISGVSDDMVIEENVLVAYQGDGTEAVIPDGVETIGDYAFLNCTSVTKVTVPYSVAVIGKGAFRSCTGLTDMVLPEDLTVIGSYAFHGCSSWTGPVVIPTGAETIENYTFYGCSSLPGELDLPETLTSIGNYAFYNCSALSGSLELPEVLTSIGAYAFYNCSGLTGGLKLPETLTSIGGYAFYECNHLTGDLRIPDAVTSLGNYAFYRCVRLDGTLTLSENLTTIPQYAFYECGAITGEVVIPEGVTTLGSCAFNGMDSLESVVVGSNVTEIGSRAFYRCSAMTSVTLRGLTVPTISGGNMFESMTNLETVYLPSGAFTDYVTMFLTALPAVARLKTLDDVGEFLISDQVLLSYQGEGSEVTIPEEVTAIDPMAFYGCKNVTNVSIPDTISEIGVYAFRGCTGLTGIELPDALTSIGDRVFYGCTGVQYVTFPANLTSIGNYAFYQCSGLTGDLVIPASVSNIGEYAFYGCSGLDGSLIFEASDTVQKTIGRYAFEYCRKLTGLELGYGITEIGHYAFGYCDGITSNLVLPESLTTLGNNAFYECRGFTGNLVLPDSVTSLGTYAFYNCMGFDGTLVLSNGLTSIPQMAFGYCSGINGKLVIPDSVASVAHQAFCGVKGLTSVEFGENVTTVGTSGNTDTSYNVFYECSNITEVTFKGLTPPTFYGNPFYYMTGLETVYVPAEAYSAYTDALSSYLPSTARIQIVDVNSDFQIEDGVLVAYSGEGGEITVPDEVTAIGTAAFQNCTTITKVTLPESVTVIGDYAFSGCSALESVNLPDGVTTIGAYAFKGCLILQSDDLPTSLTSIGTYAFYDCKAWAGELVIPDGVTTIADYTFTSASSLTSIVFGTGLTTLGSSATKENGPFYGCSGVTSITFKGQSVPAVSTNLFASMTNLAQVHVPAASFGDYAAVFAQYLPLNARMTSPDYTEELLIRDNVLVAYFGDSDVLEIPEGVTSIGVGAFQGCKTLTRVTIPAGVTAIGDYAFKGCTALTELMLPDTLTSIGKQAFRSCTSLSCLELPDGLTEIGEYAFYLCSGLTGDLVIPASVTTISQRAFRDCTGLTGLVMNEGLTVIGDFAFYNCTGLTGDLVIPDTVTKIGQYAFAECRGINGTLTLSESLTTLSQSAFYNCRSISGTLRIPDNMTETSYYCFANMGISAVVFGKNFKKHSSEAFVGCTKVKTVTFTGSDAPDANTNPFPQMDALETIYVPAESFVEYANSYAGIVADRVRLLTSDSEEEFLIRDGVLVCYQGGGGEVVVPESVTTIGKAAFRGCESMTKVTIPEHVTEIGDNAFGGCTGLTRMEWPAKLMTIGDSAFFGCTALTGKLIIPDNVTTIGASAFQGCSSLLGLEIGNNITGISGYTFYNCTGLTGDLVIPDSVTTIGNDAFKGCSGLDGTLTLSENLTSISSGAFQGCSGITGSLIIPDGVTSLGYFCFTGMSSIDFVMLGSNMTTIGLSTAASGNPFYNCSGVTEVAFTSLEVPTFNGNMFVSMSDLQTVYVLEEAYDAYVEALAAYLDESVTISTEFLAAKVTGLKAERVYSNTICLGWNAHTSEKVVGYTVSRDGEVIGTTESCMFTDRNLTTETDYTYTVQGYTADGETTGSSQVTVQTVSPEILDIKTASSANKVNDQSNTVYIHVVDSGNLQPLGEEKTVGVLYYAADGEYVLIGEAEVDPDRSTSSTAVYVLSWDLADLPEGEYEVLFRLTDIDGASDEYSETLTIDRGIPAQIVGVTATGDINVIHISWAIASELDTTVYRIYRRVESDENFRLVAQINGRDTLHYSDSSIRTDRIYYYYVVGVNELNQEGVPSLVVGATLVDDTEAPVVTKLTPQSSSYLSCTETFTLTAEDNVYVTGAELAYSVDEGETWTVFAELQPGDWSAEFDTTALEDGIIRVKGVAWDAAGNESTPLTYVYAIDNTGPEQVQGLSWESTNVSVTLRWEDVADEDIRFYRVERMNADGTYVTQKDVYDTLGVNIYDLMPGTAYTFRVVGYDAQGNRGTPSENITATTMNDTTAPVITRIRPLASYFSDSIPLTITAEDEYSVAAVTVQISSDLLTWQDIHTQSYSDIGASRTLNYTLDLTGYAEGGIYVRAIARDAAGNTSDSGVNAPYVQYIIDRTAPEAPQNVAAVGYCGYIEISWTQGSEADLNSYAVYRAEASDGAYVLLEEGLTTINYFDRSAEEDKVYYYKVAADDIAGNQSQYSAVVSAQIAEDTEPPVVVAVSPVSGTVMGPGNNGMSLSVRDNHLLASILIEYSPDGVAYSTMYELTDMTEYGQNADAKVPVTEFADGETVYIRVSATDKAGNVSDYYPVEYTVDAVAPAAADASAAYDSEAEQVTIAWTGAQEADLYGYRIYRGVKDTYSLIAFCEAVNGQSAYTFTDVNLPVAKTTATYKVEAVDHCGNTASVLTDAVEIPDRQFPRAVISCDNTMEIGVEYLIDASLSTDNSAIVSYLLDFGDGTTSTEATAVHSYGQLGEYTITLTVTDDDGHETVTTKTICVVERGAIGTVKIKVVDENGAIVPGAPVYFDLGTDTQTMKKTDSKGYAVFIGAAGVHAVGSVIANNEWLPAKKDVIVLAGAETTVTLTLVHQTLIEGEFEVNRMTFEEIEAAGIDTSDPENQYVVQVNVKLMYESVEQETSFIFNMTTQEVKGEVIYDTDNDGVGDREMTPIVISETAIALLDVPIGASMLKEFFDVHLHIVNNAASEFAMLDNAVTLHVPEGLTIVEAAGRESSAAVEIPEIPGQTSTTISWILRGDQEGEYDLSADYTGILGQFDEPIHTRFVSREPIVVYGMSNVKLIAEVNSTVNYDAFYFNLGLQNVGQVDVNLPSIEVSDNVLSSYLTRIYTVADEEAGSTETASEPAVRHLNTILENASGYSQYIGTDTQVQTLSPGETVTKKYAAYNVSGYDNLMYLKEAVYEITDGYGIQFELIETDMDLFNTDDAAGKLADIAASETKMAELSEILDCSQYSYVLEALNRDTNIFVREGADLYSGMKKRMAIDASYPAAHTGQITRAAAAQLMVDESMQQSIDAAADARYLEITGNVLAVMGEWVAADCTEADAAVWTAYLNGDGNIRNLAEKLAGFGTAQFVEYLTGKLTAAGLSGDGAALIRGYYDNGSVSDAMNAALSAACGQISSLIAGLETAAPAWSDSAAVLEDLIGIAAAQEKAEELLNMLIAYTDAGSAIQNELLEIRDSMSAIEAILAEQFDAELEAAVQAGGTDAESMILECLNSVYGTETSPSYTLIRLTFGSVDDVLTWSAPVEDLHVLQVCTEISLALRQAVEKYGLAAETDAEAIYTLNALKYLIKMRLIGKQCFVLSMNSQSEAQVAEVLEWINTTKGASYASLDQYLDAAQERLLTYRDNLFASYYTNLEIPAAPQVTINYLTNATNEEFSGEYEYSFEGSVWHDCTGGTIPVTPGTVNRYLWVRVKETATSLSGNIAKVVIPAMPRISGDISMMYMDDGYQITGLSAGTYEYVFTNERTEQEMTSSFTVADGEIIKILAEDVWTYLAIRKTAMESSFTSQIRYLVEEQPWVINTDTYVVTGLEEQTTALQVEVYYAVKGYTVTVVDANGETTEQVGTGCIVTLDGETYRTVISGDVDGNAAIDVFDLFGILDYVNGDGELDGVYYEAGRLTEGEDITLFDLLSEIEYITNGSFTGEE